jgi:methylmalonyl-CoA mutase N-terminal domain/subunit
MKERLGATQDDAMKLRFHAQTAGSTLTAQQPENNLMRVTLQALAAVMGGAQSLHTNSMDEALALPSRRAATLALRTQQILAHESGIADFVDAMGGSYELERLTDAIEAGAEEYLAKIDGMGGAVKALETGFIQREIADAAYKAQQALDAGEAVVVGVNSFRAEDGDEAPVRLLALDPEQERAQTERTRQVRSGRDPGAVQLALGRLAATARGTDDILEPILEAVEAYATLGEISDALRRVFGSHQESVTGV